MNFENFIIQCCKAGEANLRKWIKKVATRRGFSIYEDNYISDRAKKNKSYETVHNMLLVRGKPKVCLVAHTDICRDHNDKHKIYYGDKIENKPEKFSVVEPVIRKLEIEDSSVKTFRRVITDKTQSLQVGGDDRLGVAINLWVALNSDFDVALLFTTDEEVGLCSARAVDFPQLKEYDLCLQVDRGNHSRQLVTKINGTVLCDYDTAVRLLAIAWQIGLPRSLVVGAGTDVVAMKQRGVINNAVNMTCGYHESHGDGPKEYIDIEEAKDTMRYVGEIVKHYFLENV